MSARITSIFILATIISFSTACPDDSLCLQCRTNQCTFCVYSYPNSNGVCTSPTAVIPGCYSYVSNNKCGQCQDGYYYNANAANFNQTCSRLSDSVNAFCIYSFISTTACSACSNGVLSNGGGCIQGSNCVDPGCDSCYYDPVTGNQYCRTCLPGFSQWSGALPSICVPTPNLIGCASFYTLNYCDVCLPGFYWQNGICIRTSGTRFGSASRYSMISIAALVLILFRN